MPCFHPLAAWRIQRLSKLLSSGKPVPLEVPCGKCIGCQQSRQRAWALRITHEAACHKHPSSFVTLTYNDDNYYPSLNYSDFKLFIRRFNSVYGSTRYFCAGEYGSLNGRPHFHAILFGVVPHSKTLADLWPQGFTSIGEVNSRTAAYVAKYSVKAERSRPKFAVDPTTGETVELVPEFARMSRNPGIGSQWFEKYWTDVYAARDGVVLPGGVTVPPPRYYDKKLEALDPSLMLSKRLARAHLSDRARQSDGASLASQELVAISRARLKKDKL